ncbi:MAG: alpha/beta hydrolase [Clostridia bacterium]|nr:alpha/beta hydrolase [Clostridia bacterium]
MSVIQRILSFLLAVVSFFTGLLGMNTEKLEENEYRYGIYERNLVDIILPENASGTTRGVILGIYGGAWITGDKEGWSQSLREFASKGYVAAALNYRHVSDSIHVKDELDDIENALRKIKEVAAENGIKVEKVMLTGQSAGAHLSMLYAYSRADSSPLKPCAVVSEAGPANLANEEYLQLLLGDEEKTLELLCNLCGVKLTMAEYRNKIGRYPLWLSAIKKISPVSYAKSACPTVIAHGMQDGVVPYSDAVRLDSLLTQAGVAHDFIIFPDSGHFLENDPAEKERLSELFYGYAETYLN